MFPPPLLVKIHTKTLTFQYLSACNIYFGRFLKQIFADFYNPLLQQNTVGTLVLPYFASTLSYASGSDRLKIINIKIYEKHIQGDQLNMDVYFWYIVKSDLFSVHIQDPPKNLPRSNYLIRSIVHPNQTLVYNCVELLDDK